MMPIDWGRTSRIIRYIQGNGIPATLGLHKYLLHEIVRMGLWQRQRLLIRLTEGGMKV